MSREESAALRAEGRARRRRRPADGDEQPEREEEPERKEHAGAEREERPRKPERPRHGVAPGRLPEIATAARAALRELRGVDAEAVSGVARTPSGWKVTLEVVELRRIPESTDVLASYDVELDEDGGVLRFERGRRYSRSEAGGGR